MSSDYEIESYEHAGLTVEIQGESYIDEWHDPRGNDGNLGEMHICYPGYTLGDEQLPEGGFEEIDCPVCEGGDLVPEGPVNRPRDAFPNDYSEPECHRCENYYGVEPTVDEWLKSKNAIAAMPLFVYEHSGITISCGSFKWLAEDSITRTDVASSGRYAMDGAGWDTSFVGFILVTDERIKELGVERTPENIERQLEAEVKIYASYLEGDVVGWVVTNDQGEVLDSCGGYLGYWDNKDYIQGEANAGAEGAREEIEDEQREREFWAARDVITTNEGGERTCFARMGRA